MFTLADLLQQDRKFINPYLVRINDYGHWVFTDDQAPKIRGLWAREIFKNQNPLHVEIGTGNGFHFADYAQKNPAVSLVGFEIKFKTLVQTIARARNVGCVNGRMIKGDARQLSRYFADGEVQKLMIHFPDPWPKPRHHKNRLMSADFYKEVERVLAPGGVLEFKTDHREYFLSATEQLKESHLVTEAWTEDLHNSPLKEGNFVTQFERLFLQRNHPINAFVLRKPLV